jgi:hypothetical protein
MVPQARPGAGRSSRWRRCPLPRRQQTGCTPGPVAPRTASDLDSRLVCCPPRNGRGSWWPRSTPQAA